ncbi:hypothetical protein [Parafrankia sp. EAN1pec]|uniref:hypothetical protein n=1 Tax=Parafrankia sp. (strain EAN1pec) TaxID=298653 RepID=UPI0026AEFBDA
MPHLPRLTPATTPVPEMPPAPATTLDPSKRPRSASALLASCLLVGCLVVQGCSGSDDSAAPPSTPASGTPGASQQPTASTAPPAGTPTASRTTRIQGADGDVEVGFVGLRVDGQLARLDLLFTPRYAKDPGTGITLYDMAGRRDAAVTLVDSVNLRRYTVVRDSAGVALGAASGTTRTRNNVPVTGSFTFAAPPADVTTVDVYLNDRVIVDDAAITR